MWASRSHLFLLASSPGLGGAPATTQGRGYEHHGVPSCALSLWGFFFEGSLTEWGPATGKIRRFINVERGPRQEKCGVLKVFGHFVISLFLLPTAPVFEWATYFSMQFWPWPWNHVFWVGPQNHFFIFKNRPLVESRVCKKFKRKLESWDQIGYRPVKLDNWVESESWGQRGEDKHVLGLSSV